MRKTWRYIGKVYREKEETLLIFFLAAWIPEAQKSGR